MSKRDPCKPFACKIQDCLNSNNFQEFKCQDAIESMRKCCQKWGKDSFVCQGFNTNEPQKDQDKSK